MSLRVRIERPETLAGAAGSVARCLRAKPTNPVLAGVLLTAEADGRLVLEGFDHDTATRFDIAAETGQAGRVLVSARLLAEVTKLLPKHSVELESDGAELVVRCGASRSVLPAMPIEDYPHRPTAPAVRWQATAGELVEAVSRVVAAADSSSEVPWAQAVALHLPETGGEGLRLYATDSFSLAEAQVPATTVDVEASGEWAFVPARGLEHAARVLDSSADGECGIGWDGTRLALVTEGCCLVLGSVEVKAPDYAGFFDRAGQESFCLPRSEFEAALKRLGLYKDALKTRIDCTANTLRLAVRGASGGSEELLAIDYTGPGLTVGMFTHRLATALHAVGGDLVHITIGQRPNQPWLLRPVDDTGTPQPSHRHLVMPAQLHESEAAA